MDATFSGDGKLRDPAFNERLTGAVALPSGAVILVGSGSVPNGDADYLVRRYADEAPQQDVVAPETTIDSGPQGNTSDRRPTFSYHASEIPATFQCRLNGGPWGPCGASTWAPDADLPVGTYVFEVRATDGAGNVDATPASRGFTIVAPPAAPSNEQASQTASAQPTSVAPTPPRDVVPPATSALRKVPASIPVQRTGVITLTLGTAREDLNVLVTVDTTSKGARSARTLRLARTRVAVKRGAMIRARIALPKQVRRALRRRSIPVKATIRLTDVAGNAATRTFPVRLRGVRQR